MTESEAPPVVVKPCQRCGQFVDMTEAVCWVCSYPDQPQLRQSKQGIILTTVLITLFWVAASFAIFIALMVSCFYFLFPRPPYH